MSRFIRLFLCFSILLGFCPLNLRAETGHQFIRHYLNALKTDSPDLYKDLTSNNSFKTAFCGVFFSKSNRDGKNGVNSFSNKPNLTPNLFIINKLNIEKSISKLPFSSDGELKFESLSFDVLTPPPRSSS